jgi:formate dehydrogenase iron-sulfur subunit
MSPRPNALRITPALAVLIGLAAVGLALIAFRFAYGLGAATNLSDGYPWGFWIGMDILAGIALAAGGFVVAGVVHLFGGHRFHALARPAILTAFLGYLLFIFALMVDLGRPWNIWWALISWNHYSPMFEVAWCVMFYTGVLALEFTPAVLERLGWDRVRRLWFEAVPFFIMALLSLFTFAMTGSARWTGIVLAILALWETLMRTGVMRRDRQMPVLLIMAGVIFSTLHQSSLGTLFLITDKLGPLWYTPILPALFFLSAVMVGPAMVIVEGIMSGRALGRRPELDLLRPLGRAMPYLLALYLLVRLSDLVLRGEVLQAMRPAFTTAWWWLEIVLVLVALAVFATPELARHGRGLLLGAWSTVLAVVVHRCGVAIIGLDVPEYARYVPAWSEVLITAGIAALGVLGFRLAVAFLPIYEEEPAAAPPTARAVREPAVAPAPVDHRIPVGG